MTEETNTDSTDGATGVDGVESGLVKSMRKQIRDLEKTVSANDPEALEERIRTEVKRESEVAELMDKAGYPKLTATVLAKVEGDVTAESVTAALADLGLTAQGSADDDDDTEDSSKPKPGSEITEVTPGLVGDVANLGSDLNAATANAGKTDPLKDIGEAETMADLTAIAAAEGFLQT